MDLFLVLVSLLMLMCVTVSAWSGVCYARQSSYTAASRTHYQIAYRATRTTTAYGLFGLWRRPKYLTSSYQKRYVLYYSKVTYFSESHCCHGYIGSPQNRCTAQCTGGCQNGGTCMLPEVCTCPPGWTGANCETDVNECNGYNECDHLCTNVDGSYICSCDPGYELQSDSRTCEDVDECLTDNGGCTQTCDNIAGSYQCSCWDGYELGNDTHTCTDIGKCLIGAHNCSQVCVELDGGFECACSEGYELNDDGVTCADIDECEQGTAGCSQGCRNTNGNFICNCNKGYQLHHNDPTFCVDVDECISSNGGCQHICKNEIGSYQCLCHSGHLLGTDEHTCPDINECSNSNGGCQHDCTNINGSYYCSCDAGYSLDKNGHNCSSIIFKSSSTSIGVMKSTPLLEETDAPISEDKDDGSIFAPLIIVGIIVSIFVAIVIVIVCGIYIQRRLKAGNHPIYEYPEVHHNPGFHDPTAHQHDENDANRRSH